ncbi:MAG: glyoxalase/bleomycin resistance/dioxygenase family protein [Methylotenera sp.]|jgi:catechol-2,3-dioxygenase|uniref:ArsI/CadI family heavy metal resistance metalloenzyme n=1 Tax=Methylotenera sp. TaxID=2051956 RepID=UPI000D4CC30F|nr:ArsI/CadI family heavy metal resistance metalloenzyme [Methylotenera sp.]PPC79697.1 MAG: glyoxalase/bleomycin resistance/dioxygenase family protein [Methylotenera sp.]PPC92494.1 MAG: glyoxalase/bleomycin resistance/dioxygenase family protein [Methylotenera sp.]
MKRMHLHVSVDDLNKSIGFYSSLFGAAPTVSKPDYAKWMLDDPLVNFAISKRGATPGLDHIGIQVESDTELSEIKERLEKAELSLLTEEGTTCCYAKSDKHWVQDPSGIAWETYRTLDTTPTFSGQEAAEPSGACCVPAPQKVQFISRK